MLKSVKALTGLHVQAADGEIGKVNDVYFDDERWTVRYLIVDTGGWLRGRKVLVSPYAVSRLDLDTETVMVDLVRQQVEGSPDIDTDKPVSRQQEREYHRYYGYPLYWPYTTAWAYGAMPTVKPQQHIAHEQGDFVANQPEALDAQSGDIHLRSGKEVMGYQIKATNDILGHVEDFLFEPDTWVIHYLVLDTRSWLPGRHVIVPPEQVSTVSWPQREVAIELSREEIERSPQYDGPQSLEGAYKVYEHSRRPPNPR